MQSNSSQKKIFENMTDLAALLRRYRKRAGLTQKGLAGRIHFHHSVISRTETPGSGYLPSETYLEAVGQGLELSESERESLQRALEASRQTSPQPQAVDVPIWRVSRYFVPILVLAVFLSFVGIYLMAVFLTSTSRARSAPANYRQIPAGGTLYVDDFEDGELSNWRNLNDGRWEILPLEGGFGLGVQNQPPESVPNAYLLVSDNWIDYAFSVDVVFQSGQYEQIYLVARSARQPNCSGYRAGGNRLGVSIFRFDNVGGDCQGETLTENSAYPLRSDTPYNLRLEVRGADIRFLVNDQLAAQARDEKYPQGGLGLLAYQVKMAYFDNVVVTKLGR